MSLANKVRRGSAVVAAAGLLVALGATPASAGFEAKTDYATDLSPISVAIGDFDADGKQDVASANLDAGVSVLMGNGDGTLDPKVDYAAGLYPGAVATGDFNEDGKLDLVAPSEGDDTVSVLLGIGDGTFDPRVAYSTGDKPLAVAVADFNADGNLDLAVACSGMLDNAISVLLGNGDGTFDAKVDYVTGNGPDWVVAARMDGDAHPDLVVSNRLGDTVSVLIGNGDGTFDPKVDYTTGAGSRPEQVFAADLNADGSSDLAVAGGASGTVSVLFGNGDGTVDPKTDYAVVDPRSVVAADLDKDGDLDLAVSSFGGAALRVFSGNGLGGFGPATSYVTADGPYFLAVGDLDGDTDLDLVVPNFNSESVSVFLNDTPPATEQAPQQPEPAAPPILPPTEPAPAPAPIPASSFADLPSGGIARAIRNGLASGPERVSRRGSLSREVTNPFDFAIDVKVTFREATRPAGRSTAGRTSLLGRTQLTISPRRNRTARIRLSKAARKRLARLGSITVTQAVVVRDRRGGRKMVRTGFKLLGRRGR